MMIIDRKKEILKKVELLNSQQLALFDAIVCERLMPNFTYFSNKYNLNTSNFLQILLDDLYQSFYNLNIINKSDIPDILNSINEIAPDTAEYTDYSASFAVECCTAFYYAFDYLNTWDSASAKNVSGASFDTSYGYIAVTQISDHADPKFDDLILNNAIMKSEIDFQINLIDSILSTPLIDDTFIKSLKNRWPSKIDLTKL